MFVIRAFGTVIYGILCCALLITAVGAEASAGDPAKNAIPDIQKVTSSGGIEAWLVESHALPFFTLAFSFGGGSDQDPANKSGVSNFLSLMLDQGAGDLDATAFRQRKAEIAMHLSFKSKEDTISGRLEALTEHKEAAVKLLRLALTQPRFDQSAIQRTRKQILADLTADARDPHQVALKTWNALAFPGRSAAHSQSGTRTSVQSLTRRDLSRYHKRILARDGLRVVAVGNIDAAELRSMLDELFGALPAKQRLIPVDELTMQKASKVQIVRMPVDHAVMIFGVQGLERSDPDFAAAEVMNHILGGDYDFSRLWSELRERHGLVYSAFSRLNADQIHPTLTVHVDTRNKNVPDVINLVREEMQKMVQGRVSNTDLLNAKQYLSGSFALNFSSNANISDILLWMKENNLGEDYLQTRMDKINAVSVKDVARAAKRLLKVDDLRIVVVGNPGRPELCRQFASPKGQ